MRRILYTTVSYPVMNLVLALARQAAAKNTDKYRKFATQQSEFRFKKIFCERPFQPVFG